MYRPDYSSSNKSANVDSYFLQNCYGENILREVIQKLDIRNFGEGFAHRFVKLNIEAPPLPVSGARALTGYIKSSITHIGKNSLEVMSTGVYGLCLQEGVRHQLGSLSAFDS
jgi:hypothetical protein